VVLAIVEVIADLYICLQQKIGYYMTEKKQKQIQWSSFMTFAKYAVAYVSLHRFSVLMAFIAHSVLALLFGIRL
jgi:hypothetical protein